MEYIKRKIEHFNLEQIARSGQCFRMNQVEEGEYRIQASDRCLTLYQQEEEVIFLCGREEFETFWEEYFDLKQDYSLYIGQAYPRDAYLAEAIQYGNGMRILKQDLWEMIVSFLISQQNNIVRIRRCIENICEKYGKKMTGNQEEEWYAFPEPEALAGLPEDALMECNLGYRSKYVVRAARSVVNGEIDLEAVKQMSHKKAKEELLKLFGVGEKVAECICLFGLHHLDAFPVDTHIRQALDNHYKRGFPNRRYRGFRGVMQQYIFYYELWGGKQ